MSSEPMSPARERVLEAAEQLFSKRGYHSVTLRDIADALGMKQASLYNHAPGGKEELYIEVMERGLMRHRENLVRVMDAAAPNLRTQLRAAARWLLSQPPVDMSRMASSDMPAIAPEQSQRLMQVADEALFSPINSVLERAYLRGETRLTAGGPFAAMFITNIEGLHHIPEYIGVQKQALADDTIDILLDGVMRH